MSTVKKPRWIPLPLEPAAPWWELPALTRTVGQYLFARAFGAEPDEPVLGIELELVVVESKKGKSTRTYPKLETWALSLLSPQPDERKTIRAAVRRMVERGLMVPVQGGIRLLYRAESYASFHAEKACGNPGDGSGDGGGGAPQPSVDGGHMVGAPSVNGAPTVHSPSANGAPTVPQQSPNHTPTVGYKSAELQGPTPLNRERETEKTERERRARGFQDLPLRGSALYFASQYELRFAEAHQGLPVTWGDENVRSAKSVGAWLDRLGRELEASVRALLDGFFTNAHAGRVRHALRELAKAPESYFATDGGGDGVEFYGSTEDEMGPPTDLGLGLGASQ